MIIIDLKTIYGDVAKIDLIPDYIHKVKELAGKGNDITLTGQAPVWMYLVIAHALHGTAKSLTYDSPVTGQIKIFDHNPF